MKMILSENNRHCVIHHYHRMKDVEKKKKMTDRECKQEETQRGKQEREAVGVKATGLHM